MSNGSASRASIYEKMTISNDSKEADISAKTASFNYFESVYSPEITANLIFLDASGSIKAIRKKMFKKDLDLSNHHFQSSEKKNLHLK